LTLNKKESQIFSLKEIKH